MIDKSLKRRLRAIFSADVKGYSRLMGEEGEYTIKTITALLLSMLFYGTVLAVSTPQVEKRTTPGWVVLHESIHPTEVPFDEIENGQYFLHLDNQIKVDDNGPTQHYEHMSIYVVNETGVETSSQVSIEFDPNYQKLILHQLIIRRNGDTIDKLPNAESQLLRREKKMESQIYDGRYTSNLIVDDVRIGDIIEYAYTIVGDNSIYNNIFSYWLSVSWSVPVKQQNFILHWPKNRALYQRSLKTPLKLKKVNKADHIVYSLDQKSINKIRKNTQTPSWYLRYGMIQMTETRDWSNVVLWALPLFRAAYQKNQAILNIAKEIQESHSTDEQYVIAALNYIQKEIRYLGIEMGVNSHQPSPPEVTLTRRYGDCKDKSVVLIALLETLGFKAKPVLVNTYLKHTVINVHPTIDVFNHVIVRATVHEKDYWLDPALLYQGSNLSTVFQPDYMYALVIAPGSTELTSMPSNVHLVGTEINEIFDLQAGVGKPIVYTLSTRYRGLDSENMRNRLAVEGVKKIQQKLINFYSKYYPEIELASPIEIIDKKEINELKTIEKYRIEKFWKHNKEHQRLEAIFYSNEIYPYLKKPKQRRRKDPYQLTHPLNIKQTIRVLLPEPFEIDEFDNTEKNPYFKLTAKASYDEATTSIELIYHYQSFKDAVMPDKITEYIAAIDKAAEELDFYISETYTDSEPSESMEKPFLVPGHFNFFIKIVIALVCVLFMGISALKKKEKQMKQFKIFVNSGGAIEAVKIGWSWPAFFFNIIWALVKKMYLLGIGLFVALIVFFFVGGLFSQIPEQTIDVIGDVANIIIAIIFGAYGNKWRESNLQKRGFDLKDTVNAKTPENAKSLYLKEKISQSLSLENMTKKCPACAENIKLEARKCRFCGEEIDPEKVGRQLFIHRTEQADATAKQKEGKKQCPECKSWDVYQAMLKDGGMGDYCPNCQKSLKDMALKIPTLTATSNDHISLENETKKCPACAENIKLEARKCRFCGEEIDPEKEKL